jgi:CRISPR/Cas system CSM-associated protein Csm3 (group 7 of RAMP superfamily)
MKLKYKIKFFDYWHLSSGLSGGAKFDSITTKDENDIPYVPGKTIKGLCREASEKFLDFEKEFINKYFGSEETNQGSAYFSNALIERNQYEQIVKYNLQDNLYDIIASTKIDDKGIAKDKSLREIEVVIPLELSGEVLNIDSKDDFEKFFKILKMIKRMGLNRNRGLGRCEITEIELCEN